ncbi:MAG: acetylxylan esterase [Bryobacteraceae bacterium]
MRPIALALFFTFPCVAQDEAAVRRVAESKRQVTAYLEREARAITDRAAAEIASAVAWEKVRDLRLEELRDMLGLLPWPEQTPLNVQVTGVLEKDAYTVEKIAFESLPKFYVTGNLYVPKARNGPVPGIIYVCGHAYSPHGDKAKYQRHGISFAKNGYVAFILDSIQIAETFALHHGVYNQEMYDWYARGYTPAGVEVWNAMRAIDYLETRVEVDKTRIGITGRSGGAAMSWFTTAVDPRIRAAVPVMGISTYAANVRENTQRRHCDCMFPINSWMHDMLHQGALIAPRPLLMAHGRKDLLFPVAGYEEFAATAGKLYRSYGKGGNFAHTVVETGHEDSAFLREQAIRWFDKYLLHMPDRKLDLDYSDAPEESLTVFSGNPPADAQNHLVHETFTARLRTVQPNLFAVLKEKVFASFPASAVAPNIIRTPRKSGDLFEEVRFTSEPGIEVRALMKGSAKERGPALLYVASDGDDAKSLADTFRPLGGRTVMVIYPRGIDEIGWEKSFWKDVFRNAMHTGRTVDSMRLWDVLRAAALLRAEPGVDPGRILIAGRGVSAGLALYAAFLDSQIQQVLLFDPPSSHTEGPIFLNVLRYTDLPEVAARLAPRRVSFYARIPPAYGSQPHYFRAMNLHMVLEGRYDHRFASGW